MTIPIYFFATSGLGESNLLYVLKEATPEGKVIIAVLVVFSMFAWSVMISKFLSMRRAKRLNEFFTTEFRSQGILKVIDLTAYFTIERIQCTSKIVPSHILISKT